MCPPSGLHNILLLRAEEADLDAPPQLRQAIRIGVMRWHRWVKKVHDPVLVPQFQRGAIYHVYRLSITVMASLQKYLP